MLYKHNARDLFPGTFLYKIKSGRAHLFFYNMLHGRNARVFFPGIFLYKIKSGRAHLFFYNMLHRWNARDFFFRADFDIKSRVEMRVV